MYIHSYLFVSILWIYCIIFYCMLLLLWHQISLWGLQVSYLSLCWVYFYFLALSSVGFYVALCLYLIHWFYKCEVLFHCELYQLYWVEMTIRKLFCSKKKYKKLNVVVLSFLVHRSRFFVFFLSHLMKALSSMSRQCFRSALRVHVSSSAVLTFLSLS